ncbi:NAD-dependent epimerase/dehydratase family protein [Parapedobacter indicus]|uniref:Nucleoside-diphosphate-sugar epimerase n=1 Tax=Parapedobacter indicus TaxID=1477437 RepID=A0A1I3TEL1_9SPHI|nr:NAD-dependent epimerase/dehydratase family protein [Parapedobacter indicus]PPK99533.1 nucleoside-diphosphate-sugar epimerase [Parapedobacter indicus]SFJ68899.1 Nucleoside-diphosphate-sugar epimerase [Parapedobacter indicus]
MAVTTVIISGSNGFVGQNLGSYLNSDRFKVYPLSLRDEWEQQIPDQYDVTIHLAGKAHDIKNSSNPKEYFHVNTDLTKQLFGQFLRSNARDFIYFSSVKAVADTVEGVLDEFVSPDPQTPYGQSKWQAEQYLNSQPLPAGKRVFILRPCMIHGPGNKGNLNLLYKMVKTGLPYPLAAFQNRRSFLSIDNLQFVVKSLITNPDIPSGTYNLADDEALSTNELIRIIGEARGRRTRLWRLSPGLINGVAKLGDKFKLPLNTERLKKLTENYVVGNTKIKNELKIAHMPISAREGLLKTLRSF